MTATEGPDDRPQDTCRVSCVRFVFHVRLTTQTWSSATALRSPGSGDPHSLNSAHGKVPVSVSYKRGCRQNANRDLPGRWVWRLLAGGDAVEAKAQVAAKEGPL